MIERPFLDPTPEKVRQWIQSVPLYAKDDDASFWPEERFVARRNELLRRQIGWIAVGSPYYQKVFAEVGVQPDDIRTTEDLASLPVTRKADLMADPPSFRLDLPDRSVYDTTYVTLTTTGTTAGRPTPYEYTTHDWFGSLLSTRRLSKMLSQYPGELQFSILPLSPLPHVSGFVATICTAGGSSYYCGLGGMPYDEFPIHNSTESIMEELLRLKPASITGVGSFMRRMLRDMADQGCDLSSVVALMPSAEILTQRMLDEMVTNLMRCGAARPIIASPYNFTEGGVTWSQAYENGPLQCTSPDQMFIEILDEETLQPMADGEVGLVAVTHLNRRGMPLLRYLVGDRGAITNAPCERTGRVGQALLVSTGSAYITRSGDICKVKGTLVNPAVIHEVIMQTPDVVEYQARVSFRDAGDELSGDRFRLLVAVEPDALAAWRAETGPARVLRDRVRDAIAITPEVEIIENRDEIYDLRKDFKAKRFVDERGL